MSIKKYNAVTPSLRHRTILRREKKLIRHKGLSIKHKYHAGRNIQGRITVRHQGGRAKRIYRCIDLKRQFSKYSFIYGLTTEYDPNRKTNITRVYSNKFKCFYINTINNKRLRNVYTDKEMKYDISDHLKLKYIPIGHRISNIQPLNFIRSPGTYGFIISKKQNTVMIKLPSKRIIEVNENYTASIGRNDNINHNLTNIGKAGANRWLGKRPTVKGNVMNAVDHPHGGNTKGGNPVPKTKWGKKAKWIKKIKR